MSLCINVGSGDSQARSTAKGEVWLNLDLIPHSGVDVVSDLEEGLPFQNESVDILYCSHVVEHLHELPEFMQEALRVLKPRGVLHIKVPMAGCRAAIADPTHYQYFVPETFYHFDEDSNIGYDTLGMRRMGFWLKWMEVVRWHRPDIDDEKPGTYFTEIIVDYEKKGPAHEWETHLLEIATNGESINAEAGRGIGGRMLGFTNPSPLK
jgi:SAM-dependent methyltransferase